MQSKDPQEQLDLEAARATWESLAAQARGLHCPVHYMPPWRVAVIGDTPAKLRLQISGCCSNLQVVVNEMIGKDPRITGRV